METFRACSLDPRHTDANVSDTSRVYYCSKVFEIFAYSIAYSTRNVIRILYKKTGGRSFSVLQLLISFIRKISRKYLI